MLRVDALLRMPELRLRPVVGGPSPDRVVTGLYGTELPDPGRYLSGGELVLSGLLWHRTAADCETFVAALARSGAAALAAAATDGGGLPDALVEACRRHGVPLLEVPVDLSFAIIIERVVRELAAERVGDAGAQLGRHRRLLTVVAEGGGLAELVAAGATELGAPCRVLSTTGHVVAGAAPPDAAALVREFLRADRQPLVARGETLLPVPDRGGHRTAGWVLVVAGDRVRDEVAAELAGLVGVVRSRVVLAREIENRAAGPLLHEVRSGTGDVAARLVAAGRPTDVPLRVLVASASDGRVELVAALLAEALAPVAPQALIGVVGAEVHAVAPAGAGWVEEVRAALRTVEPGLGATRVLVGVSSPVAVGGLRGAAEEASHARRLGERRAGRTCVVAGEEIALHRLLLAGVPEELRGSLRRRVLGPVLDYDAEHGTDLVGTLRVFLDCSGSWTTAAARLHVHVNTLRYRIGRVAELLNADLSDFTCRVDLYLALHVS
ncbi:helix-turn-helix domain-containing protein [Saccharothrix australiensis]|uniref:DNA-binding PucR family transcriptional regulator n=1 Tax=Saccharothrix australiensis TaxID=2072 RepID=A0A495W3W5_9PSEU|nr:PucR family transcriptional regulator ligand-binding domain-containing protein [Saccharothrix australiensis]RKT56054.1 DNA-binding PucR family transcriptional regulator [Saccharothrix australiensis]